MGPRLEHSPSVLLTGAQPFQQWVIAPRATSGGIIDDNSAWSERFEGNNSTVFTDGVPYSGSTFTPTELSILLSEDSYEPNDSRWSATNVSLPFSRNALSIDQDNESDYYKITVPAWRVLKIDLDFAHSAGNVNVALYNSSGSLITSSTSATNDEYISRYMGLGGTYYVRVYGSGSGSCNRYDLDIWSEPLVLQWQPVR